MGPKKKTPLPTPRSQYSKDSYDAYRAEIAALERIAAEERIQNRMSIQEKKQTARGRPKQKSVPSETKQKQLQQQAKKAEILHMGPFFLWFNENRKKLEDKNPQLVGTYLMIKAGETWIGLNSYERSEYEVKVRRAPLAYIQSLIEIGQQDFDEEYQQAKMYYDIHHAGKN